MIDPVQEIISFYQENERKLLTSFYNLAVQLNTLELQKITDGTNSTPSTVSPPQSGKESDQ